MICTECHPNCLYTGSCENPLVIEMAAALIKQEQQEEADWLEILQTEKELSYVRTS